MSEELEIKKIVGQIAAAYLGKSYVAPGEIPAVISQIAISLAAVRAIEPEAPAQQVDKRKLSPAQIRKSITRDALISFEDNRPYKTLRRHLASKGLSPETYRSMWGLPDDYPMVAPSYREARASLAKAHGFSVAGAVNDAPAATAAPPEPAPEAPRAEPARAAPVPAAVRKPNLGGLGLTRKSASTPTAFRPSSSIRDPETSARHKRWLAMLSETDWARIRAIARQVNAARVPPTLTDLSAPLRVRACLVGQEARFPGEYVGTLRSGQVAVLISERGEH